MLELTHIGTDSAIASGQGNSSGLIGFTQNKIIVNDRANDALLFPNYAFTVEISIQIKLLMLEQEEFYQS